jgi:hypothetical protein
MERCAGLMPLGISPLCNDLAVYPASVSEKHWNVFYLLTVRFASVSQHELSVSKTYKGLLNEFQRGTNSLLKKQISLYYIAACPVSVNEIVYVSFIY